MERKRKSCCTGRSTFVSTIPKKEQAVVTPKKEENVKPHVLMKNEANIAAGVTKAANIKEKDTAPVNKQKSHTTDMSLIIRFKLKFLDSIHGNQVNHR
ncbi:hypothetical protein LguiB_021525 [Lonicera macranthoides]